MNDINLPPLPYGEMYDARTGWNDNQMRVYAIAAVLADREKRGEPVAWLLESSSDRGIKRELSFSKPHVPGHWAAHPLYQHPPQPAEKPEPVAWRFPVKVWIGEDRFEVRWKTTTTPDPDREGLEPLYTAPQPVKQRAPLAEEQIEQAYRRVFWRDKDRRTASAHSWIEAGIREAERLHGIVEGKA